MVDNVDKRVETQAEKEANKRTNIIDILYNKGKKGGDLEDRNKRAEDFFYE